MKEKIIYFSDELNDEFAGDSIKPRPIDKNYKYGGSSPGWKIAHFFWYKIVAWPVAKFFMITKFHHKIVGREKIKSVGKSAFFIYGNHTNNIPDALIPTFVSKPRDTFVIVNANNVSMPVLGQITPYLGALPLPDNFDAMKNFMAVLKLRVGEGRSIMIYPEAHIWPYYTKIRPFTDLSFKYPVDFRTPVFCLTNTYQKYKKGVTPQIVTYVDGPFYADENLSGKEKRKALRDMVYNAMCERAKMNNIEVIKYIRK